METITTTASWFPYSIASVVLLGMSVVFYKMPSVRKYSPFLSTFWANLIALLFVCVFFYSELVRNADFNWQNISWWALLWGLLFAITMTVQKMLLHKGETNAILPVTSSFSAILTILAGIIFLSEKISWVQILGGGIVLLSVYLFTRKRGGFPLTSHVVILAIAVVLASVLAKYVQKFGLTHESIAHFMFWQYVGASIFGLIGAFVFEEDTKLELASARKYILGSFLIGIFSFFGGWAISKALQLGPLSMVYAIHPSYIFVTALAGFFIFKENLTQRKILLIILSILGVILIKIG